MTIERVTAADLHARRALILAEHPHLASWRPACTRCRSVRCNVTTEGLSADERGAVVELDVIRSGLGEDWPAAATAASRGEGAVTVAAPPDRRTAT